LQEVDFTAAQEALEINDSQRHSDQNRVDRSKEQKFPVDRSKASEQHAENGSENMEPKVEDVDGSYSCSESINSQGTLSAVKEHVGLSTETSRPVPETLETNQLPENHLDSRSVTRGLNDHPVTNDTKPVATTTFDCSENSITEDTGNLNSDVEVKPPLDARLRSLLQYKSCSKRADEPHGNAPRDFRTIQAKLEKEKGYQTIVSLCLRIYLFYRLPVFVSFILFHLRRAFCVCLHNS